MHPKWLQGHRRPNSGQSVSVSNFSFSKSFVIHFSKFSVKVKGFSSRTVRKCENLLAPLLPPEQSLLHPFTFLIVPSKSIKMCGGCGGGGRGGSSSQCCCLQKLITDPCYQKLCCNQRKKVCYKPFIPSYERCDEEVKMGKLLGFDYQRRWFCERNVWMCKVYGQCGGGSCC